jgi:hypothetical protein
VTGTNNGGSMPEKGPPVYLDYDQAALDAAYDQAAYAPNREQLIKRRIRDSELARLRIGEPERLAYGPTEIERVDIYRAEREATPIFVFIHGGAWRSGRSKDFATPAEMFLAVGAHYVVPDFAWVQMCWDINEKLTAPTHLWIIYPAVSHQFLEKSRHAQIGAISRPQMRLGTSRTNPNGALVFAPRLLIKPE